MLYRDYFADQPVHDALTFRWQFRINKGLFMRIVIAVREFDDYFIAKKDAVGVIGFSSIQKCTGAMRLLEYGAPAAMQPMSTCAWPNPHQLSPCTSSAGRLSPCLGCCT